MKDSEQIGKVLDLLTDRIKKLYEQGMTYEEMANRSGVRSFSLFQRICTDQRKLNNVRLESFLKIISILPEVHLIIDLPDALPSPSINLKKYKKCFEALSLELHGDSHISDY